MKYTLLSTVVAPDFGGGIIEIKKLTKQQFLDLLPLVDRNLCGHPVTNAVLRAECPTLPDPEKAFWDGTGQALAARPMGGVRGASIQGDTQVTLDGLEFCLIRYHSGAWIAPGAYYPEVRS